jgi:hypothetical protein
MVAALLEGMTAQVRLGKRAENAFKKEAWTAVVPQIQACINQTDENGSLRVMTQGKASAKLSDFKGLYVEWRLLKEASGFGWNDQGMPTAPDDVWHTYLRVSK